MKPMLMLICVGAVVLGCSRNGVAPDGSGTIECTEVDVAPQVAGVIASLPAEEGMALKKGDVVALIDPANYELRCREARAALAQATAQLDLAKAGPRAEDIQRAREQVREVTAVSASARATLDRVLKAYDSKSVTDKQVDDARAAAEQADAARAGAEQALERLVRGSREEELRIAGAAVDLARARLDQAEKALADTTVTAPMDGTVTTKNREPGEYVAVGAALVTLARLDEVWLSIYIPEDRLGRVKLGQAATVTIDGDARRYQGKVTFVSPEAEFTPRNVQTAEERAKLVYRVKITLPNPEGVFKPGMPADGYLEVAP